MMGLTGYVILSSILFSVGLCGVLIRKNIIGVLISVELMLNAINISAVAFSHLVKEASMKGDIFALFVMVVAAAEVSVGLAIVLAVYKAQASIDIDKMDSLKG